MSRGRPESSRRYLITKHNLGYLCANIKDYCASNSLPCTIVNDGNSKKEIELGHFPMNEIRSKANELYEQ